MGSDGIAASRRALWLAFWINAVFLIIEAIGGWLTGSLALLADAGHMFTDVAALAIALLAGSLAQRAKDAEYSYGWQRAEIIGAFINGASLVVIVGFILLESLRRLAQPVEVTGLPMLIIAIFGLLANAVSAWILHREQKDNINVQGAFLHMMADAIGSVGAIISGLVILLTGWMLIDVLLGLSIALLISWSSIGLLRRSLHILMEGTPESVDIDQIRASLESLPSFRRVKDLHVWTVGQSLIVLTAHVLLVPQALGDDRWIADQHKAEEQLRHEHGIDHITIQVLSGQNAEDDS